MATRKRGRPPGRSAPPVGEGRAAPPRFWETTRGKIIIGSFSLLVAAITGFAQPEVREWTCLQLPSAAALEYEAGAKDPIPFSRLASPSAREGLDGKRVEFRARVYGEFDNSFYRTVWSPALLRDYAILNVRPLDYVESQTPFGSELKTFPPFAVLVPREQMAGLVAKKPGEVFDFVGTAHFSPEMHADSPSGQAMAKLNAQMHKRGQSMATAMPGYASFHVIAATPNMPALENDPRDRVMCRIFHKRELAASHDQETSTGGSDD